jgi:hypothetical protein
MRILIAILLACFVFSIVPADAEPGVIDRAQQRVQQRAQQNDQNPPGGQAAGAQQGGAEVQTVVNKDGTLSEDGLKKFREKILPALKYASLMAKAA